MTAVQCESFKNVGYTVMPVDVIAILDLVKVARFFLQSPANLQAEGLHQLLSTCLAIIAIEHSRHPDVKLPLLVSCIAGMLAPKNIACSAPST